MPVRRRISQRDLSRPERRQAQATQIAETVSVTLPAEPNEVIVAFHDVVEVGPLLATWNF